MLIWESIATQTIEAPGLDAGSYELVSRVYRHATTSYNEITGEPSDFNLVLNRDFHLSMVLEHDGIVVMTAGLFLNSMELGACLTFLTDISDYDLRDVIVASVGNWTINLATDEKPFSVPVP